MLTRGNEERARTHFQELASYLMEPAQAAKAATSLPPPVPGCPLTAALQAIGGKWNLICLYWLDSDTRRFSELRRLMPEVSHKVLSATLRNLEREGLVSRTVYAEVPPRVEYRISSHGETVRELIRTVRVWGREHLERKRSGDGQPRLRHSPVRPQDQRDRRCPKAENAASASSGTAADFVAAEIDQGLELGG